jgi:hypothetical protein
LDWYSGPGTSVTFGVSPKLRLTATITHMAGLQASGRRSGMPQESGRKV